MVAHFDLNSNGWLAFFADLDLLVVTLDTGTVVVSQMSDLGIERKLTLCLY